MGRDAELRARCELAQSRQDAGLPLGMEVEFGLVDRADAVSVLLHEGLGAGVLGGGVDEAGHDLRSVVAVEALPGPIHLREPAQALIGARLPVAKAVFARSSMIRRSSRQSRLASVSSGRRPRPGACTVPTRWGARQEERHASSSTRGGPSIGPLGSVNSSSSCPWRSTMRISAPCGSGVRPCRLRWSCRSRSGPRARTAARLSHRGRRGRGAGAARQTTRRSRSPSPNPQASADSRRTRPMRVATKAQASANGTVAKSTVCSGIAVTPMRGQASAQSASPPRCTSVSIAFFAA